MSNIFGSPRRFREDDWWKRDSGDRLIDDLKARLNEEPTFKRSSFSSTQQHEHKTSSHESTQFGSRSSSNHKLNDEEKEVFDEKDQFIVKVDVSKFPPEKVQVKVSSNNTLYIDAVHEEKTDGHNYVTRTLSRKFVLPNEVDIQTVVSHLNNGLLTICAPKKGAGKREERVIHVKLI